MSDSKSAEAWLDALEALEPEPTDSAQRKGHLKWKGERLRSLLRGCQSGNQQHQVDSMGRGMVLSRSDETAVTPTGMHGMGYAGGGDYLPHEVDDSFGPHWPVGTGSYLWCCNGSKLFVFCELRAGRCLLQGRQHQARP